MLTFEQWDKATHQYFYKLRNKYPIRYVTENGKEMLKLQLKDTLLVADTFIDMMAKIYDKYYGRQAKSGR